MSAENLDLLTGWASFILTLFIFSYLLGDNFLYRIAVHVLVGSTAGYVALVSVNSVILPWVRLTIFASSDTTPTAFRALGLIPFLIGVTLLLKLSPRLAPIGNVGLAFIVGVGAGIAIVGAVVGTVIPLTRDAGVSFEKHNFLNAAIMVLGTIGTLVYFQYLAKRFPDGHVSRRLPIRVLAGIGQATIAITLGAVYGGLMLSSLSVLSGVIAEQLTFLMK